MFCPRREALINVLQPPRPLLLMGVSVMISNGDNQGIPEKKVEGKEDLGLEGVSSEILGHKSISGR